MFVSSVYDYDLCVLYGKDTNVLCFSIIFKTDLREIFTFKYIFYTYLSLLFVMLVLNSS